jgi:hypothetical protein
MRKAAAPTTIQAAFHTHPGNNLDFDRAGRATQAAQAFEGREYARAFLDRLRAGAACPGDLAVVLGFLSGELLNGACHVLEKALEGSRHE